MTEPVILNVSSIRVEAARTADDQPIVIIQNPGSDQVVMDAGTAVRYALRILANAIESGNGNEGEFILPDDVPTIMERIANWLCALAKNTRETLDTRSKTEKME